MSRTRVAAVVWTAGVLAVALVLLAPARLLGRLALPPEINASGYAGTLWRGSAARVLLRLPAGTLHLGQVDWRLHPASLLRLQPALSVRSQWGEQRFAAELRWLGAQDVQLRDGELSVAAGLLRQLLPVELGGRISAQVERLTLRDGWLHEALGRVVWEQARWRTPQADFALGTYALHFGPAPAGPTVVSAEKAAGSALRGEVITLSGPLEASGEVLLSPAAWSLALDFSSEGGLPAALANALSLLATPVDSGYRLRLSGELQNTLQ